MEVDDHQDDFEDHQPQPQPSLSPPPTTTLRSKGKGRASRTAAASPPPRASRSLSISPPRPSNSNSNSQSQSKSSPSFSFQLGGGYDARFDVGGYGKSGMHLPSHENLDERRQALHGFGRSELSALGGDGWGVEGGQRGQAFEEEVGEFSFRSLRFAFSSFFLFFDLSTKLTNPVDFFFIG